MIEWLNGLMVRVLGGYSDQSEKFNMENDKKYLSLNDITSYVHAFELSNFVWNIVIKWSYFSKSTLGKQFVDAIDSISANIAEGFGRYGKKDRIKFYQIAKGSLSESLDWNNKAITRKLLSKDEYTYINNQLQALPREINSLIKYTNIKLTV